MGQSGLHNSSCVCQSQALSVDTFHIVCGERRRWVVGEGECHAGNNQCLQDVPVYGVITCRLLLDHYSRLATPSALIFPRYPGTIAAYLT